ncbi:MAG TPA: aminotransferase class I/II-fold pyridoxal phosphate-dependent enzyme [Rectinemataceae bacterium]|nr:aminotransferase class I/II-fold pyridoxal phosphate-dependent enzyme [Rectinemataceae bacterium]
MFKPFELERYFAKHEFSARYLLCTSDCESMSIRELLSLEPEAEEGLHSTWLGYTESRGNPMLRKEIAALYDSVDEDEVLVHAGAEEAILNLFTALVRQGQTVIVNSPCYQSLSEVPRALGARVLPWHLRPTEGRWFLDPDELAELLAIHEGGGTGAPPIVVMNMPHNPTGAILTRGEFDRVVSLCENRGAILVCDEVYRFLETDPRDRLPAVCDVYENGISLSVLSKAWGLAGLRIGWLAAQRRDILDLTAQVKDYNSICASAPSETLAGIALRHSDEIIARNWDICANNLAAFSRFFADREDMFEWIPPRGGSVAFPRLRIGGGSGWWVNAERKWTGKDSGLSAAALAERLLEELGILILPGICYDYDPAYFRIGLGRKQAGEALTILDQWLDAQGL